MRIANRALTFVRLAAAASIAATACASDTHAAPPGLPGTSWQLVSIQSMDDAQGITAIPDPSTFTVTFDENGTDAFFQIDCNRGRGSYTLQPGGDGSEGELEFGPIATTMMMCPQPSLDSRVSKALAGVRTYLIDHDELHMSEQFDSAVLTWKRTAPKS